VSEAYPNQRIYEKCKFKCAYCGIDGSKNFTTFWHANFNVDHIKPISKGGADTDENKVLACRACNLYKGSTDCNSIAEATQVVEKKRAQAEAWYNKHVLQI